MAISLSLSYTPTHTDTNNTKTTGSSTRKMNQSKITAGQIHPILVNYKFTNVNFMNFDRKCDGGSEAVRRESFRTRATPTVSGAQLSPISCRHGLVGAISSDP